MGTTIKLNVNGAVRVLEVDDPDMPLLMPSVARQLTDGEIAQLAAYYSGFPGNDGTVAPEATAADHGRPSTMNHRVSRGKIRSFED